MRVFNVIENNDGTWHIECRCVIYRALHNKHPDWAKPIGDAITGFYTKYYLLIEDNFKTMLKAILRAEELENQYAALITECENTGNWGNFPFADNLIVYYN